MHRDRKDSGAELEKMYFLLKSSEENTYGSQNTNSAFLLQNRSREIKLF